MKQANKMSRRKKEKWNFKPWLIIAAILLLLFGSVAILTLCSGQQKNVLKFSYENGEYYDEKNDITYVEAPFYYQSKLMTSKDYPYAQSEETTLYRVGYRDEEDKVHLVSGNLWLSTSMEDGALLYYNRDKVDLPDFTEFGGDSIYICEPDGTLFSTTKLDSSTTQKLLADFFSAEESEYNEHYLTSELIANLKVSSSQYDWLYLNLWLYSDDNGDYYLCEDTTRKFVKTDADVFDPLFTLPEPDA